MKKDTYKTDVIFRVDNSKGFKGTVFAILPHEVADHKGNVTIYQHVGQHSAGDYNHCIKTSQKAIPAEYNNLKAEMESFGYDFNIRQKQHRAKYLNDYKNR